MRLRHYGTGPAMPEKEHDYDFSADSEFMRRVVGLAGRLHLPIAIHLEAEAEGDHVAFLGKSAARSTVPAFERLLADNRGARVIWSHLGRASPEVIDRMLRSHPNLYTDVSDVQPCGRHACGCSAAALEVFAEYPLKNSIIDENGRLKDAWRALFERYPDRIMLGTDAMSAKGYGPMYRALTDQLRDVLAELSPATASKIAGGTAREVFCID
jgi:predicted TIM-barrel fold metal-dependent hydrolase